MSKGRRAVIKSLKLKRLKKITSGPMGLGKPTKLRKI